MTAPDALEPVVVSIPVQIVSVANRREHWSKRSGRTKEHRGLARIMLSPRAGALRAHLRAGGSTAIAIDAEGEARLVVRLTRVAPKAAHLIDKHDNLMMALKGVADGVTDALCGCRCPKCQAGKHANCRAAECFDDADGRVRWVYDQSVNVRGWSARVEIRPA